MRNVKPELENQILADLDERIDAARQQRPTYQQEQSLQSQLKSIKEQQAAIMKQIKVLDAQNDSG